VAMREGMVDLAAYDDVITDDTALVTACSGYFVNGFTQDVGAIVKRAHGRRAGRPPEW
jgi:selenocysteine lyase/cysteine desulfurase